jgi:hypothetical protein
MRYMTISMKIGSEVLIENSKLAIVHERVRNKARSEIKHQG